MTTVGSCYFPSRHAAEKHYIDVDAGLESGAIHIGKPPLNEGEVLVRLDNGTRYGIQMPDEIKEIPMTPELLDSIKLMIPEGNKLKLPTDIQFENYPAVKKCLIDAGGKYKACAFIFADPAIDVQERLLGGEAINDKKKFQFFPTPEELACRMVEMADLMAFQKVLEPQAGQGAIAHEIKCHGAEVTCVELMPQNCEVLRRKGYDPIEGDFLTYTFDFLGPFERIIMNPPFTKNQDIDHIMHAYGFLAPDVGRMVTLASKSWQHGSQKKQVAFREWLSEIGAHIEEVPEKTFKASGTNIATMLIVIDK